MDAFLAPFIKSAKSKRPPRKTNKGQEGGVVLLSVFDIPPGLLAHTQRQQEGAALSSSLGQDEPGSRIVHPDSYTNTGTTSDRDARCKTTSRELTCVRCGLQFGDDRPAQVQHFKSDLHMANLRRQLAGKPRVSQQQLDDEAATAAAAVAATGGNGFDGPLEEGNSSSGSDSDEAPAPSATDRGLDLGDVPEEDEDALLATAAYGSCDGSTSSGNKRGKVKVDFSLQEGPRLTFVPHGSGWAFSLSSAALGIERGDDPWARLDSLVGDDEGGGVNRLWAVLILRSGKFAAAVFEGQRVLCHKVFRRYVGTAVLLYHVWFNFCSLL